MSVEGYIVQMRYPGKTPEEMDLKGSEKMNKENAPMKIFLVVEQPHTYRILLKKEISEYIVEMTGEFERAINQEIKRRNDEGIT